MAYGVVYTTNIHGRCVSLVDSANAHENGEIVYTIGEIQEGELAKVGGGTGEIACLVANPAWSYDESHPLNQLEDRFINAKGVGFRGYELMVGDKFELSADAISGGSLASIAVGDKLNTTGGKLAKVTGSTAPTKGVTVVVLEKKVKGYAIKDGVITSSSNIVVRVESVKASA